MRLLWRDTVFDYPYAVKKESSVIFYNEMYEEVNSIIGISSKEWHTIVIQNGEWTSISEIPTTAEHLKADIEFLEMENEFLQADLDYCLMLLENV